MSRKETRTRIPDEVTSVRNAVTGEVSECPIDAGCSIVDGAGWYWVIKYEQHERPMHFNKLRDIWTDSLGGEINCFWDDMYKVVRKCS